MKLLMVSILLGLGVQAYAEDVDTSDINQALKTLEEDFDGKYKTHKKRKTIDTVGTAVGVTASIATTAYTWDPEIDRELTRLYRYTEPYSESTREGIRENYRRLGQEPPKVIKTPAYTREKGIIKRLELAQNLKWLGPALLGGSIWYGVESYNDAKERKAELDEMADCYRKMSGGEIVSVDFYEDTGNIMNRWFRLGNNRGDNQEDEEYDHRKEPNEDEEKGLVRKTSSFQKWAESLK